MFGNQQYKIKLQFINYMVPQKLIVKIIRDLEYKYTLVPLVIIYY